MSSESMNRTSGHHGRQLRPPQTARSPRKWSQHGVTEQTFPRRAGGRCSLLPRRTSTCLATQCSSFPRTIPGSIVSSSTKPRQAAEFESPWPTLTHRMSPNATRKKASEEPFVIASDQLSTITSRSSEWKASTYASTRPGCTTHYSEATTRCSLHPTCTLSRGTGHPCSTFAVPSTMECSTD